MLTIEYQTKLHSDPGPRERCLRASRAYGREKMARHWTDAGMVTYCQLITRALRNRERSRADTYSDWLDLNTPENLKAYTISDLTLPRLLNSGVYATSKRCNYSPAGGEDEIRFYQLRNGVYVQYFMMDRAGNKTRFTSRIVRAEEVEGLIMRFRGFSAYAVAEPCPNCGSKERLTLSLTPATMIMVRCRGCSAEKRAAAKERRLIEEARPENQPGYAFANWPDSVRKMAERIDLDSWLDCESDEDEARGWSYLMYDVGAYTPAMRRAQIEVVLHQTSYVKFLMYRVPGYVLEDISGVKAYGKCSRHSADYIAKKAED